MKNHHQCNWLLKNLLILVILFGCDQLSIGQSGFPFAYGDQVFYYPKLADKKQNIEAIKSGLTNSLKRVGQIFDFAEQKTINSKDIKSITILNDRIQLELKGKRKVEWLFSAIDDSTMFFFGKRDAGNYIFLPSVANFAFGELDAAQQFADNIYAIQYPRIQKVRDSILIAFKEKFKKLEASKREIIVSDEQKKLFLLADTACNKLEYLSAIKNYNQGIQIDEMAYPRAYANLALLYAQINYFDYAILCIQKYICLETDATALGSAKDKMYEWEGLIHYSNHTNAQDRITSFNPIKQDSILNNNLQLLKNRLYQTLLQNLSAIEINQQNANGTYNLGTSLNINLSENELRFVCSNNIIANIHFKDIKDIKFKIVAIENNIQNSGSVTEFKLPIGNTILSVKNDQRYLLINITRQFITLQKLLNDQFFYVNTFKQMAMITNAITNKPYITEVIRRHIIQAEAFTKLYNYEKAIDLNYELIAIHPTAYPSVYLNIAVLLAETNKLHSAIYNMQKFLLLKPTKEDEEFAKSKISEWEIILNN